MACGPPILTTSPPPPRGGGGGGGADTRLVWIPNITSQCIPFIPTFKSVYHVDIPTSRRLHASCTLRAHTPPSVFHVFHFLSRSHPDTMKQLPLSLLPTAPAPQAQDCASDSDSRSSEAFEQKRHVSKGQPEHMRRSKRKWVFRLEWKEGRPWLCYHVDNVMWCSICHAHRCA